GDAGDADIAVDFTADIIDTRHQPRQSRQLYALQLQAAIELALAARIVNTQLQTDIAERRRTGAGVEIGALLRQRGIECYRVHRSALLAMRGIPFPLRRRDAHA